VQIAQNRANKNLQTKRREPVDVPDERDDYFEVEEVKETQQPGVFK
jgi:hypothetical protein